MKDYKIISEIQLRENIGRFVDHFYHTILDTTINTITSDNDILLLYGCLVHRNGIYLYSSSETKLEKEDEILKYEIDKVSNKIKIHSYLVDNTISKACIYNGTIRKDNPIFNEVIRRVEVY